MKKQSHLILLLLAAVSGACPAQAATPGTVVVWGYNHGVRNVPPGLTNVTAIAAGPGHAVALKSDGSVVAWGYNYYGQTNVPPGLSNVTAIAAGEHHTMALKSDGTVVGWGAYGWTLLKTTVPAGLSNVTAISAGFFNSAALKSDGTVVTWDDQGQAIALGASNVTAISVGFSGAALISNGTVLGWGADNAENANVMAISASCGGHTLALKSNGTVVAWGYNDYGQTDVPPGLSNVTAISAGGACPYDCGGSSVALRTDGTVVAWGLSSDVPAGLTNVTAIAAGLDHTVAIVAYPPVLTLEARAMGDELILSWSTNAVGFTLQSTPDLTPPVTWIDSPAAPSVIGGQFKVTNVFSGNAQFYRLKKL
jgi:hypothetical protein